MRARAILNHCAPRRYEFGECPIYFGGGLDAGLAALAQRRDHHVHPLGAGARGDAGHHLAGRELAALRIKLTASEADRLGVEAAETELRRALASLDTEVLACEAEMSAAIVRKDN